MPGGSGTGWPSWLEGWVSDCRDWTDASWKSGFRVDELLEERDDDEGELSGDGTGQSDAGHGMRAGVVTGIACGMCVEEDAGEGLGRALADRGYGHRSIWEGL